MDDLEVDPTVQLTRGEHNRFGRRRVVALAGEGRDADRSGAHVQLGQAGQVMRQDMLHPVGEPLENLAHVERLGERGEECLDPVEPVPAAALDVPQPPVLHGRAQQSRDRSENLLMLVRERVRTIRG